MGISPYKMVYGKSCHLPLELEHKVYWSIKSLNFVLKSTGEKQLLDIHALDELINEAYENARIFKEKFKRWHDKRIEHRVFKVGDKVLLSIYFLTLFLGNLKSRCEGPHEVGEAYPSGGCETKRDVIFSMDR
jgi:hypothetical protein